VTDPFGGLPPPPPEPAPPPEPPQKRPFLPVTYALLAALALAFAAEGFVGHDASVESGVALLRMGALYLPAVRDGDWWRLGSYAFLHIGWLHIAMNAWSLWILLPQLELAFGSNLTLGFFSATSIAGGAASVGWAIARGKDVLAAGASGGLFGLFGATIALAFRTRHRFSPQTRKVLLRQLVFNLLINAYIAFSLPVDSAAHIGGFLSGLILGMLAPQRSLPQGWWQKPTRWFVVASALVLASMEGAAVARAVKPKPRTLRGAGVEAQIDGAFIPEQSGHAGIPGAAALFIRREAEPLPPGENVERIGDRDWVRQHSTDGDGDEHSLLAASDGSGRVIIEFTCGDPFCRGEKGDQLLELTARTLRTSP
jgi:membrane associated rhomboid family serine protease